ncbi:hypothetical protein A0128_06215 [Leptospira tipperaryensis]|uniref:Uncharacterized protein n=1 Tax=Leptospira tipperaryensis TaxID=2564040 RepID=A0A1D7UV60_9LEPT|nr:hypothetical protein [Leptospira tipperaryensis]AOP33476.1 hypothetical protein A0128_06215 [Leptospira tipperaryensis]
MNPRSEIKPKFSKNSEALSRVFAKVELYCIASGITDPIELHTKLGIFLSLLESQRTSLEKKDEASFETEAMKLFLDSGILGSQKNKSLQLPELEPSRMIPNPVDFGPLGVLAEPKEKLEPIPVILSVVFWGGVYAFLLYGLLR